MAAFRSSMALRAPLYASRCSFKRNLWTTHNQSPKISILGFQRCYATDSPSAVEAPDYLDESERKIFGILKESLKPEKLEVQDISGGCGSMYALDIVSEQFQGLPVIKQHRLVNKVLGEEIKKWHGVQLKTRAP